MRDACRALFNLEFGTTAYSHFVVVFAPIPVSIGRVEFNKKRIEISLRISPEIDIHNITLKLYGNNNAGEKTSLRRTITEFIRLKDSDIATAPVVEPNLDSTYLRLEIYFKGDLIETRVFRNRGVIPGRCLNDLPL